MTRVLAIASLILAFGTASLSGRPAHAAPRSPTVAPIDHYEAGKRLFAAKLYVAALEEFRLALAISPRPEVLYSMAQTQRLLGDCASAIETYRAFLASQPDEPFAQYARLNIDRCTLPASSSSPPPPPPESLASDAWYRDAVGDALVGGGVVAGVVGAIVWRSGRQAANRLADAPDYQSFVDRRAAASSAVTKQWGGGSAMVVGGVAIVGGIVHYIYRGRSSSPARGPALGVAITSGGAMVTGHGAF